MEAQMILAEGQFAYRWKKSARRRTTAITIHPERGVVVHTPRRYPLRLVEALLREKSRWILRHLERIAREKAQRPARQWQNGRPLPFRGQEYPLLIAPHPGPERVRLAGGRMLVGLASAQAPGREERARQAVESWYWEQAVEVLRARVAHFAPLVGRTPAAVRIKAQKRRWGSCSAKGALNFNWRLILAPPPILDYVVVHELCHLAELNHSPRFWALVERVLPDFGERRAWLRGRGGQLTL